MVRISRTGMEREGALEGLEIECYRLRKIESLIKWKVELYGVNEENNLLEERRFS